MLHAILKFAIPLLRLIYLLFLFVPPSTHMLDGVWSFSKEDVEKCKQKDLLEQTMSEMIGEFPALHQTIVAERDIYLTHTLRQATRCVEAPHNSQSNYCIYFSLHPSRFCLCWHLFLMCLSICKQDYAKINRWICYKCFWPSPEIITFWNQYRNAWTEKSLNRQRWLATSICNVVLETPGGASCAPFCFLSASTVVYFSSYFFFFFFFRLMFRDKSRPFQAQSKNLILLRFSSTCNF